MENRVALWGGLGAAALGPILQQYSLAVLIGICAIWGACVALTQRPPHRAGHMRAFGFVFARASCGAMLPGCIHLFYPAINGAYVFAAAAFAIAMFGPEALLKLRK